MTAPEFSRIVDSQAAIGAGGGEEHLTATESECTALAGRLGLLALKSLNATLALSPWRGCGLLVSGRLRAEVTQSCVVSLDPVDSVVEEAVEARFLPETMIPAEDTEPAMIDPEGPEPPEPFQSNGGVDLGELVVQHLAVAIDPYPRRPDATFDVPSDAADSPKSGPFAALSVLKQPSDA